MSLTDLLERMSTDIGSLTMGERVLGGAAVTLLCMLIVFCVLVILMGCIKIMEAVLKTAPAKAAAPAAAAAPKAAPAPVAAAPIVDTQEEVAAVMAAIAAMGGSGTQMVVTSIVRNTGSDPTWAASGRVNLLNSKL